VVDLAVVADHPSSAGRHHRLVASWTEVDHGEAAMTEGDAALGVDPMTPVIGTPVSEGSRHVEHQMTELVRARAPSRIEEAGDATHRSESGGGSPSAGPHPRRTSPH